MNPLILQFANGNIFFVGLGMVAVSAALYLRRNGRFIRGIVAVTWLVGILLVILSAMPLPQWLYGIWLAVCVAGFIVSNLPAKPGNFLINCRANIAVCILSSFILVLVELPYHVTPSVVVSSTQPVFVIGDSISAGIGSKERVWPQVLGERANLKVKNLAQPGATVEAALKQAMRVDQAGALILIEIGGNDLLGNTDIHVFHQQLDQLLGKVSVAGNQVIMFEIPLIPFHNSFGAEQRTLAKKYRVTLLPKIFMTSVFGMESGTQDGLHLSQAGHDALAAKIQGVLRIR